MNLENEWNAAPPFDLHSLQLIRLVAQRGSFTAAAHAAGLTQSAITRQVQGVEERLEVALFERTTRSVRLTPAGEYLVQQAGEISNTAIEASRYISEHFADAPPILRSGVSRSMGVGYLPGFFDQFHRLRPDVRTSVTQDIGTRLIEQVLKAEIDVAIVSAQPKIASGLEVCYRFADRFVAIVPDDEKSTDLSASPTRKQLAKQLADQRWISLDRSSASSTVVSDWMNEVGLAEVEPSMELDSYDLIVGLVSEGMGAAIVPRRVLPLYARRRVVRALTFRPALHREVWVVARSDRKRPEHIRDFVESVLF